MPEERQEDLNLVIEQICEEKGIQKEKVIETIEAAIAAAFRKDYGSKNQELEVKFDLEKGGAKIFDVKEVVEEPKADLEGKVPRLKRGQITLEEAREIKKDAKINDIIKKEVTPKSAEYGRIAAQTAKQVIIQKIREAEREAVFNEYKDKEGEIVSGIIQRIEGNNIYVDLGRAIGVLYPSEAMRNEVYSMNRRVKVFVAAVRITPKGPEIILSRTSPKIVKKLFESEVPEMKTGTVDIKEIAREAGSRAKVAVTGQEGIDPIGAFVGQRGTRVQTVINELSGEKIDIIEWDEDPTKFIANSLSPAKILNVKIDESKKEAVAIVDKNQLSLAIGKNGQNVRLAARLSGWKINILEAGAEKEKASLKPGEEDSKKKRPKKEDRSKKEDKQKKETKKLASTKASVSIETTADKKTKEDKTVSAFASTPAKATVGKKASTFAKASVDKSADKDKKKAKKEKTEKGKPDEKKEEK